MATLLTFEDLVRDRDTVKIKGVDYEILNPDDFGLEEQKRLYKTQDKVQKLFNADNDSALPQARRELDAFIKKILPSLTDDVLAWLKDSHKLKIMEAFIKAVDAANQSTTTTPPGVSQTQDAPAATSEPNN